MASLKRAKKEPSVHRSNFIRDGKDTDILIMRKHKIRLDWNDRYKEYLVNVGLYGIQQIGYILSDKALITALVERWKPKTHSFHLPVGEMSITLEDVALLMALPIDGDPICEETSTQIVQKPDWRTLIKDYLGCDVDEETFRPRSKTEIRIKWMKDKFGTLQANASDETVKCYARAYMLMLLGSVLFTSRSGDSISVIYLPFLIDLESERKYSWGSAVLACMYKELCQACKEPSRQIGGPILLLQLWSWVHFRAGRPKERDGQAERRLTDLGEEEYCIPPVGYLWSGGHNFTKNTARNLINYRDVLDQLREDEIVWHPYEEHRRILQNVIPMWDNLWMTTVPLIHFQTIEVYNPGRVMRQFNRYQEFPPQPTAPIVSFGCIGPSSVRSVACNERGKYLDYWHHRGEYVILENRAYDPTRHDAYIAWLKSSTKLFLQPARLRSFHDRNTPINKLQYASTESTVHLVKDRINEMTKKTLEKMNGELANSDSMKVYFLDMLKGFEEILKWVGENVGADTRFDSLWVEQHGNQMEYQNDGEASHEAGGQVE